MVEIKDKLAEQRDQYLVEYEFKLFVEKRDLYI